MSYFSLYFISIRFTFIYFVFFIFHYDKLMEHSVADTWSCSSFSFPSSGLDSHTQVPRIDSGSAGAKKSHREWRKNKFPGKVAHICIQQRRYNIWGFFLFASHCIEFVVFWKTVSYNLTWQPLDIYLIKVSIEPIDQHTLKNVVSVLLC